MVLHHARSLAQKAGFVRSGKAATEQRSLRGEPIASRYFGSPPSQQRTRCRKTATGRTGAEGGIQKVDFFAVF